MGGRSKSVRFTVLELLNRMDGNAYSNLVLDSAISSGEISQNDKGFASRLFYGVLERRLTLEYIVSKYSSRPVRKLDASVLNILEMGIYQLLYMDSVPDSAAVNEAVLLTRQCGKSSASGFVNAVLRGFIRDGKGVEFPKDRLERLSVEYSCGKGLVELLCRDHSYEKTENFLKNSLTPHKTYIRTNTIKTDPQKLAAALNGLGVGAEICGNVPDCISAENLGGAEELELFREGMFHIQDLSSQMCCRALDPKPGETVIDLCAAPGGKTFTCAEMMDNRGKILACDIHQKRVNLIKRDAERLGISIIEAVQNDSTAVNGEFPAADKVLCDVPCSGFGVIRSKPEIKYTDIESVKGLPEIQYKILSAGASYLKPGGELVYSTCTLSKAENDDVIDRFLSEHRDFEPVQAAPWLDRQENGCKLTIFPEEFDCEGFFISKIRKV